MCNQAEIIVYTNTELKNIKILPFTFFDIFLDLDSSSICNKSVKNHPNGISNSILNIRKDF